MRNIYFSKYGIFSNIKLRADQQNSAINMGSLSSVDSNKKITNAESNPKLPASSDTNKKITNAESNPKLPASTDTNKNNANFKNKPKLPAPSSAKVNPANAPSKPADSIVVKKLTTDIKRLSIEIHQFKSLLTIQQSCLTQVLKMRTKASYYKQQAKNRDFLIRSGVFDNEFYISNYPAIVNIKIDPLDHYMNTGWMELKNPNLFFDTYYYIQYNLEIIETLENPLVHYLKKGWLKNSNPSHLFSTSSYLANNPDVANAGINPLIHYILHGIKEGRKIK